MLVKLGAGVNVGGVDAVEQKLGHARAFHVDEMGLEQRLGCTKALATNLEWRKMFQTKWGEPKDERYSEEVRSRTQHT